MVKRDAIVTEARTYEGVAWRHQGRTRENGIDCAGLVVVVGRAFGQWGEEPISNYPMRPDGTFIAHFRKHMIEKRVSDAKDGDVLIFSEGRHPCHSGICTTKRGQRSVLHAHRQRGHVIEESLASAQSVVGQPVFCFAYPGVED